VLPPSIQHSRPICGARELTARGVQGGIPRGGGGGGGGVTLDKTPPHPLVHHNVGFAIGPDQVSHDAGVGRQAGGAEGVGYAVIRLAELVEAIAEHQGRNPARGLVLHLFFETNQRWAGVEEGEGFEREVLY
jgi:hypothetical protein